MDRDSVKEAAVRRYFLMSFLEALGNLSTKERTPILKTGAPSFIVNEFPAGYSLAGCSPAEPAYASPAEA